MKKRIQFLACLLATVFLLGSTGAFADSQAPGTLQGISAERLANQEVSNLAYSKILEHYGQEAYMLPEEAESGNPSILRTTPDYGDVYAGAYLNEDGQLVVLLADPDASKASTKPVSADRPNILSEEIVSGSSAFKALPAAMKAEANELLAVSGKSTLIFQKAKYSYDYLTALTEMLSAELSAKHNNPESIWSEVACIALLDDANRISVEIVDLNQEKSARFANEAYMSEAIVLNAVDNYPSDFAAAIHCGTPIYTQLNSNYTNGSIGYPAIRYGSGGNEIGFVTAAHVFSSVGVPIPYTAGGTSEWARIPDDDATRYSGTVDASFLKTNNNIAYVSNRVLTSSGTTLTNGFTSAPVGTYVCKAGKMTNQTYGTIESINARFPINGQTFTDLIKTTCDGVAGDSGGVLYTIGNNGFGTIVGITKGGDYAADGSTIYTYYTKASNIYSVLNVYPFYGV